MGTPTDADELRYWGFSEALGPRLRSRFRGTADQALEVARDFANTLVVDVDYWDENDKSARPGRPAESLRTVKPKRALAAEKNRLEEEAKRAAVRKTWRA